MDWNEVGSKMMAKEENYCYGMFMERMVEWLYENFAFPFVANEISFPPPPVNEILLWLSNARNFILY